MPTFLLTDIEDSTRLWQQRPESMQAALAMHDAIMRACIAEHRGEIFKTAGDAFYAAFAAPRDAIEAAAAAQRSLRAQPWPADTPIRVRMAVDCGDAQSRDGDYFGPPLNLAARLLAIARGGQVLASGHMRAARDASIPGAAFESHGFYRARGVDQPVEVLEVASDGAAGMPPRDTDNVYRVMRVGNIWQPVRAIRQNLPAPRDVFIGRATELRDLARQLDEGARLVTALGSAGTGKTRLVLEYARSWLGDWPGGAYLCDLSEARTLDGIFFAVATALEVPLGKDDPCTQLGYAIAGRGRCLVLLDNFEQVAEHADATVGRWLDRAPDATFVVTSRRRLDLPGEHVFPVEPLPPATDGVALFAARANVQVPGFAVDDGNRTAVAEVVRLVDGLPLAIELAAARVRVLSPAQMVERMRNRFALLAGVRGARARQATMEAAIDWSWDLLAPWEQGALAQCSVFEGGFTLEAAEAIVDLRAWPNAPATVDVLQALVDKSLLRSWVPLAQRRFGIDEPYFGMYLSIHEYAANRLAQGITPITDVQARHGAHFATFGSADFVRTLSGSDGTRRRHVLALEVDNLLAACRRAIARGDGATAAGTYVAAWEIFRMQGPFVLAEALGTQVLAVPDMPPSLRLAALDARAWASSRAGRLAEARTWFERALAFARESGDRHGEAVIRLGLGCLAREQGRYDEALPAFEAALVTFRETDDRLRQVRTLVNLGNTHDEQGRVAEARRCHEETIALCRQIGDRVDEGVVLGNLAILNRHEGHAEESLRAYEAALAINREVGDRRSEGVALNNLGNLHLDHGRFGDARACYEGALAIHRDMGFRVVEGFALMNLGLLALQQERLDEAGDRLAIALEIAREVGHRRFEGMVKGAIGNLSKTRGRFTEARQQYEEAVAIHRAVGNVRHEALALAHLSEIALAEQRYDDARTTIEEGESKMRPTHSPFELAQLLCVRGRLDAATGNVDAARAALAEAEGLVAGAGAGPGADILRDIAKLRAALTVVQ